MISIKEKNYLFSLLKDLGKEAENIKTRKIQYEQKKMDHHFQKQII